MSSFPALQNGAAITNKRTADTSEQEYEHGARSTFGSRRQPTKATTAQVENVECEVTGSSTAARSSVSLDPKDPGIEQAIKRLEGKSFIKDCIIPEIQCLLRVSDQKAKHAYLQALSQYGLVCMLILASLLGSALNPLDPGSYPEANPGLVAAFNMLSMIICCACLFGTCIFLLEGIIMEGTPEHRVHGIIARADPLFHFGTSMAAVGIQCPLPLILIRAWISGLDVFQCIVLTVICAGIYTRMSFVYFRHLQTNWPVEAQRWTKMFFPCLYRPERSHAAIDELVAELRYLQQPREKTLRVSQLGECLEKYFGVESGVDEGGWDLAAFLQLVEREAGGRLAPNAERLAKKAFEKTVEAKLEKLADEAVVLALTKNNL